MMWAARVFSIRQFGRSLKKIGSRVIQDLIVFASNRDGTICTLANCSRNRATFNEVKSMRSELFKRGNFSGQIFGGCAINKQRYSNTSEKTNRQEDYAFKATINVTSVIKCCYSHFIYDQIWSSETHWMKQLISLNLESFTLHYELHFCPCSCVPADLWTLCRGVDAAHRWAPGGCWASYCGAPGAGHQALPPEAAGHLRTPLQTPAHNRQTAHSLVRTVLLLRPDYLLQSIADGRKSHLSPKLPGGKSLGHNPPFLSLCMPQHTLKSHSIYPNPPFIFASSSRFASKPSSSTAINKCH